MVAPIYIAIKNVYVFTFHHGLTKFVFCLFKLAITTGVRQHLTVVLIFIFLMTSNFEHIFIYLLVIFMSCLKNVCIFSLPLFNNLFAILYINLLLDLYVYITCKPYIYNIYKPYNIFCLSIDCLSIFIIVCLASQKNFSLI
uniref:Uncharacterized protein n=1 Tax=Molossus molossus TaxID=27622 RepID=A0A7J8JVK9_MOLMO|nr:hypothetical protein HJG59_007924 [Molossus molossus]